MNRDRCQASFPRFENSRNVETSLDRLATHPSGLLEPSEDELICSKLMFELNQDLSSLASVQSNV